jgi:hypothetical protein
MSCSHRPSFVLRRCRSHEAVHRGEISEDVALDRLERIWQIRIRYLGDAVLRRNAWKVAEAHGLGSHLYRGVRGADALQADAFVTLDAELAHSLEGIVPIASIDAVRSHAR